MLIQKLIDNKTAMKKALRVASQFRSAHLVARILCQIERVHLEASQHHRLRVLALSVNKDGFLQDILGCFEGTDEFEIFSWPSYGLPSIAQQILSPKINNNTYMGDDPEIISSKKKYREFIGSVCDNLSRIKGIDAVLAPNFHYSAQRELAAALEERGIPFLVLHKENLKSPGRVEFWRYMYERRGTFSGRKILVYNEIERELQLQVGVTEPERVIVTGMPRLDRIHRWRRLAASQSPPDSNRDQAKQVLFFAFDRFDKLPAQKQIGPDTSSALATRWAELTWTEICEGTHKAIVDLALKRPDIEIVVKTKSIERQKKDVDRMLRSASDPLPANIKVINGGDAFELLTASSVVIGFNSTAQLEAIAAGIPVIVPLFGEATAPRTKDFVIDLGDAVTYAKSPAELVEVTSTVIDSVSGIERDLGNAAAQALVRWTGNDDGAAGHRVLEVIRNEICQRQTHLDATAPKSKLSA